MRLVSALVVLAAALVAAVAQPAPAAQSRDMVIVPGRSIGKVRIGMTLPQVKAVLGRPNIVNKSTRNSFGGRYVEYDWGWGRWTVGFSGRGKALRVSLVATQVRRERTREGIGVGSLGYAVQRTYKRLGIRCAFDDGSKLGLCRLGTPARGETWFPAGPVCSMYVGSSCPPGKWGKPFVFEVLIRTSASPRPEYHIYMPD